MRIWALFLVFISVSLGLAAQEVPKFEIGTHYSTLRIRSVRFGCVDCIEFNHGFGARFDANLNRALAIDSEFDFFPDDGVGATNVQGGRVTTTFIGVKAGYRTRYIGVFGKLRPGMQTYGATLKSLSPLQFERRYNFALDLGGVVEYYPTKRVALRVDVGDTRIHFDAGRWPSFWTNNVQISSGVVFRF